jgi:hypothetical protein
MPIALLFPNPTCTTMASAGRPLGDGKPGSVFSACEKVELLLHALRPSDHQQSLQRGRAWSYYTARGG